MPNFTQGEWKCDFEEDKYIWSCKDEVLGELYFTTPEETKANARLIMYKRLPREELEKFFGKAKELTQHSDKCSE